MTERLKSLQIEIAEDLARLDPARVLEVTTYSDDGGYGDELLHVAMQSGALVLVQPNMPRLLVEQGALVNFLADFMLERESGGARWRILDQRDAAAFERVQQVRALLAHVDKGGALVLRLQSGVDQQTLLRHSITHVGGAAPYYHLRAYVGSYHSGEDAHVDQLEIEGFVSTLLALGFTRSLDGK